MNESELIEAAKAGCNDSKTALLQMHNGFIHSRVKRYCKSAQDRDDYLSIAQMGMLHAIERYDPAFGASLITYARNWVDQHLRRYRDTDQLVRPAHNRGTRVKRRNSLGEYDGGKLDARRSELDQHFASTTFSLNAPLCDNGEDLIDCISSMIASPEDNVLESERLRILRDRLCGRSAREVATLLRGDKTLAEVGQRFRVSRERVRQVERDGIARLRATYEKACQ